MIFEMNEDEYSGEAPDMGYIEFEVQERVSDHSKLASNYFLVKSYPNPFNSSTTITYELPEAAKVDVKIFNVSGLQIANLQSGEMDAGYHSIRWTADNFPSGVYFCRLTSGNYEKSVKLLMLR